MCLVIPDAFTHRSKGFDIHEGSGSTEHLCNGDEAEEEENNPDYFVSFEYAF
jgi:hypothetical protein